MLLAIAVLIAPGRAMAADDDAVRDRGEQIYRAACISCHGEGGVGVVENYPDPLIGDATTGQLTKLIAETMPEEDPDSCVGEDASAVAAYIHHAFYSEAAQVRNRPPQIRLARLTAEQLRQNLAGLYGAFQSDPWIEEKHGIEGMYFKGSRWNKKNLKIERTDPTLDFDFGNDSPGKGIEAKEYYIHWSGSIKPEQTGRHEIIVRSTCSFVMDFGRDNREFINNHVQSEGRDEFRRSVNLIAGRAYMFKIDFHQRKRKTKQPPASISLSWVTPDGVEEVIPQRNLLSSWLPSTIVLNTKLPADDRSYGYERGTAINRQWDESTTNAAIEFSQYAADELWRDYRKQHRNDSDDNRQRLRDFLGELVEVAFRGKLSDVQRRVYIDQQIDSEPDDAEAIRKVCLIALKSPRFLYPSLDQDQTISQQHANRLALVLHDSLPSDRWLRAKIKKDQLQKEDHVNDAAWRMVEDYRTRAKMRAFLYEWFELAHADDITKDQEKFPGFDNRLVADLRASFDAFLDEVVWSKESDYRELLRADWTFTNERLAKFYGKTWNPKDKANVDQPDVLQKSVSDAEHRIGALSHPLLMAELAYHKNTSPIHRGVFLYRNVLGRTLRPPNAAFSPLNPELHPKLTTRQRVELQTNEVNCQVCHEKINSLGFAMENYDTVGRFRNKENDRPVDATGGYITRTGKSVKFSGPRELAEFLCSNEDSHRAFVDSCFEYFVKQPTNAYGPDTLDKLTEQFQYSGFNIRELLVSIAMTAATKTDS